MAAKASVWAARGLTPQRMYCLVTGSAANWPGMRGQHQPHQVVLHVVGQDHFAHQPLPADDLLAVHDLGRLDGFAARSAIDDRRQLLAIGIAHHELEEETVELRLGQRIGAFLLDGFCVAITRNGSLS